MSAQPDNPQPPERSSRYALFVAAGIFLSRIAGLIRTRVFAHYFGNSWAGDAFNAALRIPNFLQNLFGEGVLSASFIPVYSSLLARGEKAEAGRVASAIASILFLITAVLVLLGVLATPWMVEILAPGFTGEKRDLTIQLVQIIFPGTGLLVLSAWCLGILNSHRQFFLPYVAPVIWNVAQIAALVIFGGGRTQANLAVVLAWGLVIGSGLQFGIQMPNTLKLIESFRPALHLHLDSVRTIVRNFLPVLIARGVVQISAIIDNSYASLLSTGAVSGIFYAQTLYLLPVSLFGMSISAAKLPEMSSALGSEDEVAKTLRKELDDGLKQIAFFIVPSAMALLTLGDIVAATLFQSGKFTHEDALYVWGILVGSSLSLLAVTMARLYSSTFYALKDTRTPLRYAIVRVTLNIILGYLLALKLPPLLNIDIKWGAAGLSFASGIAGWVEFYLLRANLNRRIGSTGLPLSLAAKLWVAAAIGAAVGWGIKLLIGHLHPIIVGVLVLSPYGFSYFVCCWLFKVDQIHSLIKKVARRVPKRFARFLPK